MSGCEPEILNLGHYAQIGNFWALEPALTTPNGIRAHFDRPDIKAAICKINNFPKVTSICPKYCCTELSCTKKFVEKLSFSEHKIEEVKSQSPTKFFCISDFNVESCLASCFTFGPFLKLEP